MDSKTYTYEGADATVSWDKARCIHFEACVHGLSDVFDPQRRPWIDPDRAAPGALLDTVRACPTGALHLRLPDGSDPEPVPATVTATVAPDGPLYLEGDLTVQLADGTVVLRDTRVALCRCGLSSNKPLCDNSHLRQFEDPGRFSDLGPVLDAAEAAAAGPTLTVTLRPNGSVFVDGPVTVVAADGGAVAKPKAAFCRCGHSGNKPFCDGSHRAAGFEAA